MSDERLYAQFVVIGKEERAVYYLPVSGRYDKQFVRFCYDIDVLNFHNVHSYTVYPDPVKEHEVVTLIRNNPFSDTKHYTLEGRFEWIDTMENFLTDMAREWIIEDYLVHGRFHTDMCPGAVDIGYGRTYNENDNMMDEKAEYVKMRFKGNPGRTYYVRWTGNEDEIRKFNAHLDKYEAITGEITDDIFELDMIKKYTKPTSDVYNRFEYTNMVMKTLTNNRVWFMAAVLKLRSIHKFVKSSSQS